MFDIGLATGCGSSAQAVVDPAIKAMAIGADSAARRETP